MTIYFVQPEGEPFVKIGFSRSEVISTRLRSLQLSNHRTLKLLAKRRGTRRHELMFHALLKAHRSHGEWFHLRAEVVEIIKQVATGQYRLPPEKEIFKKPQPTPEQIAARNKRRGPKKNRNRMPWDQVAKIYFDPTLRNDEIEDRCAKGHSRMSYATMYRHFGKRNAPTGRPSVQQ